ncbi:hypothetical protein [Rhodococcus sp. NPDC127528]|uniref:hypothetical protein n=1 Tax=unclassified Rhodococcus (in: high G+C Gram-positive bacteria) TaxID=192944 RepID=UPI0036293C69
MKQVITWVCPKSGCGKTRNAGCSPVCLPAQRINAREFKSARIAREKQDAATDDVEEFS